MLRQDFLSEYYAWQSAIQRCHNPNDVQYKNYGNRGIQVWIGWRKSFKLFLNYMGPKPEGLTLERINNDGNYEPGNCKWATYKEQMNNCRINKPDRDREIYDLYKSGRFSQQQLAFIYGIHQTNVSRAIVRGEQYE
jgi:hypothetical protein